MDTVTATPEQLAAVRAGVYRAIRTGQDTQPLMLRLLMQGGEEALQRVIDDLDRVAAKA